MESLSKSANVSLMNNETISLQSCTMTNDQDSFYTIPLNNAAVQIDNHLNMSTTYNDIENDVNKNIIRFVYFITYIIVLHNPFSKYMHM